NVKSNLPNIGKYETKSDTAPRILLAEGSSSLTYTTAPRETAIPPRPRKVVNRTPAFPQNSAIPPPAARTTELARKGAKFAPQAATSKPSATVHDSSPSNRS